MQRFVDCLFLDRFPTTAAELVDFGLNTTDAPIALFAAYRRALLAESISVKQLNDAVGDGQQLTALLQKAGCNIQVVTMYDAMTDEP